jgi:hypothetical protein
VPPFVLESFGGVYRIGVTFVHSIHTTGGWAEVEKLYREYPLVSTEQALHPEKWQTREAPARIAWPSFTGSALCCSPERQTAEARQRRATLCEGLLVVSGFADARRR